MKQPKKPELFLKRKARIATLIRYDAPAQILADDAELLVLAWYGSHTKVAAKMMSRIWENWIEVGGGRALRIFFWKLTHRGGVKAYWRRFGIEDDFDA